MYFICIFTSNKFDNITHTKYSQLQSNCQLGIQLFTSFGLQYTNIASKNSTWRLEQAKKINKHFDFRRRLFRFCEECTVRGSVTTAVNSAQKWYQSVSIGWLFLLGYSCIILYGYLVIWSFRFIRLHLRKYGRLPEQYSDRMYENNKI